MIRVLHSVSNMDRGGIETMLMNYYRHIDRDKIQFDFIVNKKKPGDYDDEIRKMGGRIFVGPGLGPQKYPEYVKFIADILSKNPDIKILHAHNEGMAFYPLSSAKKFGLPVRINHAHNTKIIRDYKWPLKIVCKAMIPNAATDYWACGTDAGIYYYGKKRWQSYGKIMNNAVDLTLFKYNEQIRQDMRKKYNLENKLVIGHVGRFNLQKNHTRLLDIFKQVTLKRDDTVLLLIGEGELETEMKEKAKQLGISDKVMFLGLQSNVYEWYQAMDVFAMPSLFEGLPVVGIEAQASGLPAVYSDVITKEVVVLPDSKRISLKLSDEDWANAIIESADNKINRFECEEAVREAGYEICTEAKKLEQTYIKMSERK